MEISKSSHSDTRMAVDGSSLNAFMDFAAEEKIETKEWVSNPGIGSVQQDELCQDDMFSLAELSAVEDQPEQVLVETTICTVTTTETVPSHDSGAAVEMNNCHSLVDSEVKSHVPSLQSQPQEEVIKNATVVQSTPVSTEIEDTGEAQELENNHTAKIDARNVTQAKDAFDIGAGDKGQKESQNVEDVSTTNSASTTQEDQPHLSQPETEQIKSYVEQKWSETTEMKEEEEVSNKKEPGFAALKGMQDCQKQPGMKATCDISAGDADQKELVHANQVTVDNSQCVENVSTKLAVSRVLKDQPHLNQPEKERTELIWEQKQHDGAVMKEEEENSHQRQHGLETLNGEKEDIDQKQPEMETMKEEEKDSCQYLEEMPGTTEAAGAFDDKQEVAFGADGKSEIAGGVDDKSEVNDSKVSASDGQIPSTQIENMQSENVLQNTSTLAILESNPNLPQGGITEFNAEPMEHINVEESESILKEFESLKGRKVSKRFNRKKFLGEVIGYDPKSKWFKVLYEDADEEELEKEELDRILLPVGDAKASVSRKRHLSADGDEHEKPNRSAKKSRKLDIDGTPGKSRKYRTAEDQTPSSQRTSKAKKKKSTVKGKSKALQTNTPKTQTKRKKGSSTKKTVERKGSSRPSGTKSKNKRKSQKKQSVGKIIQDSAKQHSSVTKSLKFDSAKKKTPTKSKKSSHESPPKKDKVTRSGRTVRTPNKSLKTSVDADADNKVEIQKISMAEKEEVHTPRQKRKLGSDIQDGLSAVANKRAKKTKTINDLKIQSGNIVEDANLQISHENTYDAEFQVQLDEEIAEGSFPQSTGNRLGKTDRGTVLVGRKVKKDFGGELFGGEVVGYKVFYKVKYDDGDSEELTWKELESILISDEGLRQNKNEEKQSVKSKTKQKKGPKRN